MTCDPAANGFGIGGAGAPQERTGAIAGAADDLANGAGLRLRSDRGGYPGDQVAIAVVLSTVRCSQLPVPSAYFEYFGESPLNFEQMGRTSKRALTPRLSEIELDFTVDKKLHEHQVETPFPQRDLHLKSGTFVFRPVKGG